MRLHAEAGDIGAALRQYESWRDLLKRELDVVPSPETEALHRHIRDRTNAAPVRSEFGPPTLEAAGTAGVRAESSKLSIAVLPFRNLSDETAQRYFSDGITEDIITELSRFRSLTVIARHSSFAFRDQPLDAGEIAQKLGVECIVEGSVRRAGNRIRITARLIDAESGSQLWSEHYDHDLIDIFAVQDEIVDAIVATLPGRIDEAGMRLARRKRPENLTAYDCFLRGFELDLTMDRTVEPSAHHWLDQAIAADPNLGLAYTCKGGMHLRNWYLELSAQDLDQALVLARRGADLDPNDGKCQGGLGVILLYRKEFDEAAFRLDRALALNPNDTFVMVWMAWLTTHRGRPADGLDWMRAGAASQPLSANLVRSACSRWFSMAFIDMKRRSPPFSGARKQSGCLVLGVSSRGLRARGALGRGSGAGREIPRAAARPVLAPGCGHRAVRKPRRSRPFARGITQSRCIDMNA
jgi:TolB-like protein/Tfp pilus assembly protein PilF